LASIVLTHIHADHAGGVGILAREFPRAKVYVHQKGARHLVDPSRLEASVRALYGESFESLMGAMTSTPAERVVAIGEGQRVDLGGGQSLQVLDTPGHAKHHLTFIDDEGFAYTGDAVGIGIGEGPTQPATPPSDFDLDQAISSINKIAEREPTALMFAHFGQKDDVREVIAEAQSALVDWVNRVREVKDRGVSIDDAIEELDADAPRAATPAASVMGTRTNVYGVWEFLSK
jgi:glyoxylase-like metal-dependent hydrolase (beta-lactamase superfamily II)